MSDRLPDIPLSETVPAFETALGLPTPDGKPIVVSKRALSEINSEIKEEQKDVLRYQRDVAAAASLFAKRAVSPDEIAALRRRMFEVVAKGLGEVDQVIMGQKKWTPTQTRLFAILTERVMPKLTNITVEEAPKRAEDMTVEELEAIALGKKKADAVDAVIKQADALDEQAEKHERREAKRDVIATLAHINALDEAEKEYIARKVGQAESDEEPDQNKKPKLQPPHSPESLANVRAARKKTMEQWWREKGFTEEEIAQKKAEAIAKRQHTKAQLRAEKLRRLAVKQGLGDDEVDMAKAIRRKRNETLAEFKVHGLKGVRSSTVLARDAMKRTELAEKRQRKELSPRIYTTKRIEGVPEELRGKLTLDQLRHYRPDFFVPSAVSGAGMTEEEVDKLVAERIAAEQAPPAPEGW